MAAVAMFVEGCLVEESISVRENLSDDCVSSLRAPIYLHNSRSDLHHQNSL